MYPVLYVLTHIMTLEKVTFNPIRMGGGGGGLFPPVTSTNEGTSPENFLTFSADPFATLM